MDLDTERPRGRRGFAAMDPERRREIARKGGASVPSEKRSFAKDRDVCPGATPDMKRAATPVLSRDWGRGRSAT
jgi:hypothetical protein